VAAFQPYAGTYQRQRETVRWSCYATCRVYELRAFDDGLPMAPRGRRWSIARRFMMSGPDIALLVDDATREFSHILPEITLLGV
jgi:hypothetical protein